MPKYPRLDPQKPNLARVTDTPDLTEMIHQMKTSIDDASVFYDRCERALDVRECLWAGQSPDGRKYSTDEKKAFPWEGASDARIRTVDMVIQERVMLLLAAVQKMNVQIVPTKATDMEFAQRMAALLRWYLHQEMAEETESEIELLANYQETFGAAVLGVNWLHTVAFRERHVELEDIAQIAIQQGGAKLLADVGEMLFDPRQEETMVEWIKEFSELLTASDAKGVLKEIRQMGATDFPMPYIAESRPTIAALQCMVDVIFPANTWQLQRSRWIAQRELLTEAELEERAAGRDGWDEEFVQEVLKHPGSTFNTSAFAMALADRQRQTGGLWAQSWDETDEMFEIWHFYTRATHRGVPTIMRTVLHPDAGEVYGKHEALPYAHGEYPFVEFVRERRARSIIQSRGWPELIETDQDQIKTQRDFRTDRASMTTLPTMRQSPRLGGVQLAFGPGVVIPAKQGEIEPLNFASGDNTSVEVERATKAGVNEYVGRPGEGVEPALVARKEEHAISTWLKPWQRASVQLLKLAQQYTEPMMIGRVTGLIPKAEEITPENIAGDFRLMLTFDPRFMTSEWVFGILERIEKYMLPMDRNAVLNPDAILRWAMSGIDPTLGDLAVRDSQEAAQSEVEDELHNIALMVSGVEPPMIPRGQNYAARLDVLQKAFQQNPGFYQTLLQGRPDFEGIVQRRMEFLQQQMQQDKNRVIGVYGTTPSPNSPGMASGAELGAFAMGGTN